jgi:predicted DNA-binding transcriptional regulator AlpA
MTEQELSSRWQVSIKTLQRWRGQQAGPKFIKLENRAVRYRLSDIEAYEAQRA